MTHKDACDEAQRLARDAHRECYVLRWHDGTYTTAAYDADGAIGYYDGDGAWHPFINGARPSLA